MWQKFLYISRTNLEWMYVYDEEDWKLLKSQIVPSKNTPEDVYRAGADNISAFAIEERIPIFTYRVAKENRGTRTLHQFFMENDMKWD